MEKKAVLGALVLLSSLRGASVGAVDGAVDGTCCDWWTESVEWPVEASQCPATLDGTSNATYCCGLCYAAHHSAFEEGWLESDACSNQDELPVASSSSSYVGPALALIIPGMIIFLFCVWLWYREEYEGPANVSDPVTRSSSSFVRSQLRSRYGACSVPDSQTFALDTLESRDSPSVSGITNVRFYQSRGEDDDSLPPIVFLPEPEEPASGDAPKEPAAPTDKPKLT